MEPDRWLGVELRHLAALEAVAGEGTFGRAAEKLGYTQSAVSQQIATLERIVGERLVERPGGPRPVTLTEAGRVLLRHAEAIVARLKAAQADLSALAGGEAGSLRVGTFQSVGAKVLPEVLKRFRRSWPAVEIELRESHLSRELAAGVERGELDVAFVELPLDAEAASLEAIELLRDEYVLVTAADSPFGAGRRPSLRELAAQPLIGYRHCQATEVVVGQLRATGREPHFVFRSDENGVVQGLAAAGIGVAIVPRLAVDENDEAVRIVELGMKIAPRIVGIARHRDRYHSAAARAFVETALEVGSEAGRSLAA
ncbi:MAG TPA: LysR family transcriptional regulator [Gaiellaceae bacterium]|nr:LysR family transcriptional regulator [Gaiellaceae bacterium]